MLRSLIFVSPPRLFYVLEGMRWRSRKYLKFSSELRIFDEIIQFSITLDSMWVSALIRQTIENPLQCPLSGVISMITIGFSYNCLIPSKTQKTLGEDTKINNLSMSQEWFFSRISSKTILFDLVEMLSIELLSMISSFRLGFEKWKVSSSTRTRFHVPRAIVWLPQKLHFLRWLCS